MGALEILFIIIIKQAYIIHLLITSSLTTFPVVYTKTVQKGKVGDWSAFKHWTHK